MEIKTYVSRSYCEENGECKQKTKSYTDNDFEVTVDYVKNRITVTLTDCKDNLARIVYKKLGALTSEMYRIIDKVVSDTYTATVSCMESDEFDEELGIKLAQHKASAKREQAYVKALNKIGDVLLDMASRHVSLVHNRENIIQKNTDRFNSLMKEIKPKKVQCKKKPQTKSKTTKDTQKYAEENLIELNGNKYVPHCCCVCGATALLEINDPSNDDWYVSKGAYRKQTYEFCNKCYLKK